MLSQQCDVLKMDGDIIMLPMQSVCQRGRTCEAGRVRFSAPRRRLHRKALAPRSTSKFPKHLILIRSSGFEALGIEKHSSV
jgi:hypothetical protein